MNKTPNYQLNQWDKSDRILMEDFNANNAKLEAALTSKASQADLMALQQSVAASLAAAGNCQIVTGSWVGNGQGTGNAGTGQTVTLPITPKFMVIFGRYTDDSSNTSKLLVAFVTQGENLCFHGNDPIYNSDYVTLNGNQLELTFRYFLNGSGVTQTYIAFT